MKTLLIAVLLSIACATTSQGISVNGVDEDCPAHMDEQQKLSGIVQCRAECASWGRNMVEFDDQCRCVCTPPVNQSSPYQKHATPGRVPNTQI